MSKTAKILLILITIIMVSLLIYFAAVVSWMDSMVKSLRTSKDFIVMYVDEDEIIDYNDMLNPPDEHPQLLYIDEVTRMKLSEYMRINNFVIAEGEHIFVGREPTYEELISEGTGFDFTMLEDFPLI